MALALAAQERTGSIVGRVLDASGASIHGAEIRFRSMETGLDRPPVKSTEEGIYQLALLPVGLYRVTAQQSGFQTVVREGVRVGIGWQGRPTYREDRQRSIPLAQFAPLAQVPSVTRHP